MILNKFLRSDFVDEFSKRSLSMKMESLLADNSKINITLEIKIYNLITYFNPFYTHDFLDFFFRTVGFLKDKICTNLTKNEIFFPTNYHIFLKLSQYKIQSGRIYLTLNEFFCITSLQFRNQREGKGREGNKRKSLLLYTPQNLWLSIKYVFGDNRYCIHVFCNCIAERWYHQ